MTKTTLLINKALHSYIINAAIQYGTASNSGGDTPDEYHLVSESVDAGFAVIPGRVQKATQTITVEFASVTGKVYDLAPALNVTLLTIFRNHTPEDGLKLEVATKPFEKTMEALLRKLIDNAKSRKGATS